MSRLELLNKLTEMSEIITEDYKDSVQIVKGSCFYEVGGKWVFAKAGEIIYGKVRHSGDFEVKKIILE